jgi:hypothetical protein
MHRYKGTNNTVVKSNNRTELNYFQYNNQYFKPEKGIAMGSPISGTSAEIYLQLIEERYIKHWIKRESEYSLL